MSIAPHTAVLQGHLRRQARLKSAEVMGPFPIETERMPELLLHGLHDLAHPRHPAPEPRGPRRSAMALRWTDDLGAVNPPPGLLVGVPLEALLDAIRPAGRSTHVRQARVGITAQGKACLRQGVILRTRRPKTQAGDHPQGVDRQEHMEAFIPAQPVAPAPIRESRQPSGSSALGISGGDPDTLKGCIGTALGGQEPDERQKKRHEGRVLQADVAIALLSVGRDGKALRR